MKTVTSILILSNQRSLWKIDILQASCQWAQDTVWEKDTKKATLINEPKKNPNQNNVKPQTNNFSSKNILLHTQAEESYKNEI